MAFKYILIYIYIYIYILFIKVQYAHIFLPSMQWPRCPREPTCPQRTPSASAAKNVLLSIYASTVDSWYGRRSSHGPRQIGFFLGSFHMITFLQCQLSFLAIQGIYQRHAPRACMQHAAAVTDQEYLFLFPPHMSQTETGRAVGREAA